MTDKFPEELRNFETRLLFLKEIFSDCYEQKEIIANCVQHKLNRSLELYNEDLRVFVFNYATTDPKKIKMLKYFK